jgi:hypothetical protein
VVSLDQGELAYQNSRIRADTHFFHPELRFNEAEIVDFSRINGIALVASIFGIVGYYLQCPLNYAEDRRRAADSCAGRM